MTLPLLASILSGSSFKGWCLLSTSTIHECSLSLVSSLSQPSASPPGRSDLLCSCSSCIFYTGAILGGVRWNSTGLLVHFTLMISEGTTFLHTCWQCFSYFDKYLNFLHLFMCVYVCVCMCICVLTHTITHISMPEGNLAGSLLLSMVSEDWTQATVLDSNWLYLLSHFASSWHFQNCVVLFPLSYLISLCNLDVNS